MYAITINCQSANNNILPGPSFWLAFSKKLQTRIFKFLVVEIIFKLCEKFEFVFLWIACEIIDGYCVSLYLVLTLLVSVVLPQLSDQTKLNRLDKSTEIKSYLKLE